MEKIFLSVVIPSYDEMANLQKGVLDKVEHFLSKKNYSYEVVIVDDGSKDGSVEFVESFIIASLKTSGVSPRMKAKDYKHEEEYMDQENFRFSADSYKLKKNTPRLGAGKFIKDNSRFKLIKNTHLGKAGAVTTGVLAAQGDYILFTDMDQATPIEEVDKLLPFFDPPDGGFDVVIGSRNSKRKGAPWTRLLMARGMIVLRTFVVGISGILDTQCGFKIFRKAAAKALFTKINKLHQGFKKVSGSSVSAGFDVEILYLAQKMGYKVKEVPVDWLYVETRRVSPLNDSIQGLMELLTIKINDLRGKYD